MVKNKFRNHNIDFCNPKQSTNYKNYITYLKQDFHNRCAYCNTLDERVMQNFEIDHFIPSKVFKDIEPGLETDYYNLVYSCPKCNRSKGSKCKLGYSNGRYVNTMFYHPREIDYNEIFYRNEYGSICSDDSIGIVMINELKLFKPVYALSYVCERINEVRELLEQYLSIHTDEEIRHEYNTLNELYGKRMNDLIMIYKY